MATLEGYGGCKFYCLRQCNSKRADSQPISQLVRQAVSQTASRASRQADRNTSLGSFSGRLGYKQQGEE